MRRAASEVTEIVSVRGDGTQDAFGGRLSAPADGGDELVVALTPLARQSLCHLPLGPEPAAERH